MKGKRRRFVYLLGKVAVAKGEGLVVEGAAPAYFICKLDTKTAVVILNDAMR